MPGDRCPLTVFIDAQGRLYDSRFQGRFRVTERTLRDDIGGGCKESGPTSSVRIESSPMAKPERVQHVLDLVRNTADLPVTTVTTATAAKSDRRRR